MYVGHSDQFYDEHKAPAPPAALRNGRFIASCSSSRGVLRELSTPAASLGLVGQYANSPHCPRPTG